MSLRSWVRDLIARSFGNQRTSRAIDRRMFRPGLERLEDRLAPTANLVYAEAIKSSGQLTSKAIARDVNGNLYVTGQFTGTANFNASNSGIAHNVTATGSADAYVARYAANGSLVWALDIGGNNGANTGGTSVAVDNKGNVFVTGFYNSTTRFGSQSLGTPSGNLTGYVADLSANTGSVTWVTELGTGTTFGGFASAKGVATDGKGDVFATGTFSGLVNFGGAAINSDGVSEAFVTKLSNTGGIVWARALGGVNANTDGLSVAADTAGNAYVTGDFLGKAKFGGASLSTASSVGTGFVVKVNNFSTVIWAESFGGTAANDAAAGFAVAVDAQSNVIVTGFTNGKAPFGAATISSTVNKAFVTKLTAFGKFVWVNTLGGSASGNFSHGFGLAVDASGNIFTTGDFQGTKAAFGAAVLSSGNGSGDAYMAELSAFGKVLTAGAFGGSISSAVASGSGIALDANDEAFVTGDFSGTVDFNPGAKSFPLSARGTGSGFLVKLT